MPSRLQVREEAPQISMSILVTAMDKIRLGLPQRPLEDSPAKRRMATVEVGRAVAIALTPGMPPIENLSIKPRGGVMGRILFEPQVPSCVHFIDVALHGCQICSIGGLHQGAKADYCNTSTLEELLSRQGLP